MPARSAGIVPSRAAPHWPPIWNIGKAALPGWTAFRTVHNDFKIPVFLRL